MNDKYRVLVVIRWPVGGIRTFVRYVFSNFNPRLYRFTVVAPDVPELRVMLEDLKQLDVSYTAFHSDYSIYKIFILLSKKILFEKYELVYSHGFTAGILSVLPSFVSGTKHVMTAHDVLLPKQFEGLGGILRKAFLCLLLPMINVIHSVSNDARDNLLKAIFTLRKSGDKCIAITNGIEIKRFQDKTKRDFCKELKLPKNTFLIGFLGRFMSQKGFHYLIKALELLVKMQDLERVPAILTFGSGGFIREDRAYINRKNLGRYFHFLPFASNVSSTLNGLDVVVMPSLWEACGLLAMEAMVSGTPFIGTNCIGLREILRNTPCTIVPAGDSLSLAQAIKKEIREPSWSNFKEFRGEAARRFDVRRRAAELEKVILGLLSPK